VPDTDDTIAETGEELLTQSIPGKGSALRNLLSTSLGISLGVSLQFVERLVGSAHQVVNLDRVFGTDGNPLELGVEGDLVDG